MSIYAGDYSFTAVGDYQFEGNKAYDRNTIPTGQFQLLATKYNTGFYPLNVQRTDPSASGLIGWDRSTHRRWLKKTLVRYADQSFTSSRHPELNYSGSTTLTETITIDRLNGSYVYTTSGEVNSGTNPPGITFSVGSGGTATETTYSEESHATDSGNTGFLGDYTSTTNTSSTITLSDEYYKTSDEGSPDIETDIRALLQYYDVGGVPMVNAPRGKIVRIKYNNDSCPLNWFARWPSYDSGSTYTDHAIVTTISDITVSSTGVLDGLTGLPFTLHSGIIYEFSAPTPGPTGIYSASRCKWIHYQPNHIDTSDLTVNAWWNGAISQAASLGQQSVVTGVTLVSVVGTTLYDYVGQVYSFPITPGWGSFVVTTTDGSGGLISGRVAGNITAIAFYDQGASATASLPSSPVAFTNTDRTINVGYTATTFTTSASVYAQSGTLVEPDFGGGHFLSYPNATSDTTNWPPNTSTHFTMQMQVKQFFGGS
jgi:hypothetical protein